MKTGKISTVLCCLAGVAGLAMGYFIPEKLSFNILILSTLGMILAVAFVLFFIFYFKNMRPTIDTFMKYRYLLSNLITRDLKVKYRRSFLGFLWSILNPLLMALVINAVFSKIFKFEVEYYIVYYLTGSLLFTFMTDATSNSLTSVIGASSLIKKVYIPKYIFPLEKCMFAFVNMLFSSVALIIVILIVRMPVSWSALLFFFPMICLLVFNLGVSLILSSVNVFFRDIGHLYSVWTLAWMYLTPVIYPAEVIPEKLIFVMNLNPMYHYITYFRNVVMYATVPNFEEHLICIVFALFFLMLGLVIFKKQQDRFILYI